jgi:hypothetical protein
MNAISKLIHYRNLIYGKCKVELLLILDHILDDEGAYGGADCQDKTHKK